MNRTIKISAMLSLSLLCLLFIPTQIQAKTVIEIPTVSAVAAHQWRYGFYCNYVPDGHYIEYRIYNESKKKWAVESRTRSTAGCLEWATGKSLPSGVVYCQARYVNIDTEVAGEWCEPVYQLTQARMNCKYIQKNITKSRIKLKWSKVPTAKSYTVWVDTGSGLHKVKQTKSLKCTVDYKMGDVVPIRVAVTADSKALSSSIEFVDTFYVY